MEKLFRFLDGQTTYHMAQIEGRRNVYAKIVTRCINSRQPSPAKRTLEQVSFMGGSESDIDDHIQRALKFHEEEHRKANTPLCDMTVSKLGEYVTLKTDRPDGIGPQVLIAL